MRGMRILSKFASYIKGGEKHPENASFLIYFLSSQRMLQNPVCFFLFSFLFYFLLPINRESIVLGQIFEQEILMDLHVLRYLESENHIFSVCSVCMCVRVSLISITQKQIAAETSNLVFYICIRHKCDLKLFIKIGQKLCVQGHTKEF